jgi:uncharacterized protein (DUF608 family)
MSNYRPVHDALKVLDNSCEEDLTCAGSSLDFNSPGRREFLKLAGVGVVGTLAGSSPGVMAGNFSAADLQDGHLVPADKKLDPAWVKSLFDRGEKETYRNQSLKNIGMPCGGIGSGQLYLCGDGTLGEWQIFNRSASHWVKDTHATYAHRGIDQSFAQGFAVSVRSQEGSPTVRSLSNDGFEEVTFRGEYPIATVNYSANEAPVRVLLEAFSPFIPLNAKDSALPATVFHITLKNVSRQALRANVLGWLENVIGTKVSHHLPGEKQTEVSDVAGRRFVLHSAGPADMAPGTTKRAPIVFEDFESGRFDRWTVAGDAFGQGPSRGTEQGQQNVSGFEGEKLVNSFSAGDQPQGKMTSQEFKIERPFINLRVGGGAHAGKTCVNLMVEGKLARSAVGQATEQLHWESWYVQDLAGHQGQIEIVDASADGWGHVLVDQIEFSDAPRASVAGALERAPDFGTMVLACADPEVADAASRAMPPGVAARSLVEQGSATSPNADELIGLLRSKEVDLAPGEEKRVTFVLAWHFPNAAHGQYYASRFADAKAVASYFLDQRGRLAQQTRLWRDTYYDSTLPYWLLDRLLSTASTLATGTCQWWKNGRFYAYEGVTCCEGTCTHVWNYAHTHARLFPELGRSIRALQDFNPRENGGGFHPETGLVGFRSNDAYAADGQCGTVLKAYREHQMSADDSFLRRFWPRIKKALQYSIRQDANNDGLIENTQHNTYDINYEGPNTFVGALYLAALRAGEAMAREMGDGPFAKHCRAIFESGSRLSQQRLWDGEYFIQDVDLQKYKQHQVGPGCLSDQMFGQGWAHQLGLGYLYPSKMVRSALRSVWKYNWAPDTTPYNEVHKPFRWYVSPGQAGLFTCTWPKSDYLPQGTVYKNEVWTGIEYQVAGHMIAEGMVTEGLAICRAVHDRYQPELFNPYNEVECGDHYARALASWGVYLALAGFHYHGPKGHLAFAPKITPEHFKSAFTAAEGWGTFEQTRQSDQQTDRITVRWGKLRLSSLAFVVAARKKGVKDNRSEATVSIGGKRLAAMTAIDGDQVRITFDEPVVVEEGESLQVLVTNR